MTKCKLCGGAIYVNKNGEFECSNCGLIHEKYVLDSDEFPKDLECENLVQELYRRQALFFEICLRYLYDFGSFNPYYGGNELFESLLDYSIPYFIKVLGLNDETLNNIKDNKIFISSEIENLKVDNSFKEIKSLNAINAYINYFYDKLNFRNDTSIDKCVLLTSICEKSIETILNMSPGEIKFYYPEKGEEYIDELNDKSKGIYNKLFNTFINNNSNESNLFKVNPLVYFLLNNKVLDEQNISGTIESYMLGVNEVVVRLKQYVINSFYNGNYKKKDFLESIKITLEDIVKMLSKLYIVAKKDDLEKFRYRFSSLNMIKQFIVKFREETNNENYKSLCEVIEGLIKDIYILNIYSGKVVI